MTFEILKPTITRHTGEYLGDKIRVGFPKLQNVQYCQIYFGPDVCNKFGLSQGDRVVLHVSTEKAFLVRVVKDKEGWKLTKLGKNLKLQIKWSKKLNPSQDHHMKFATYTTNEGLLELSLPKLNKDADDV